METWETVSSNSNQISLNFNPPLSDPYSFRPWSLPFFQPLNDKAPTVKLPNLHDRIRNSENLEIELQRYKQIILSETVKLPYLLGINYYCFASLSFFNMEKWENKNDLSARNATIIISFYVFSPHSGSAASASPV